MVLEILKHDTIWKRGRFALASPSLQSPNSGFTRPPPRDLHPCFCRQLFERVTYCFWYYYACVIVGLRDVQEAFAVAASARERIERKTSTPCCIDEKDRRVYRMAPKKSGHYSLPCVCVCVTDLVSVTSLRNFRCRSRQ